MEKEINSLGQVVVEKNQLLEIVKRNKEKHDIIYDAAVSGYNVAIHNYLDKVKSEGERIANLAFEYAKEDNFAPRFEKTGLYLYDCLVPSAPKNYSHEYNKTLKKLELSTAKEITLNDGDFEKYVLNNWAWKDEFVGSTFGYATGYAGGAVLLSGAMQSFA